MVEILFSNNKGTRCFNCQMTQGHDVPLKQLNLFLDVLLDEFSAHLFLTIFLQFSVPCKQKSVSHTKSVDIG